MHKRLLPLLALLAYIAVLIKVMVFKVVPVIKAGQVTLDFGGVNGGHPPNFVPFAAILPYLMGENGLTIAFLNLAGNIALLVPIGFLLPLVYPKMTWKKALAAGAIFGLAIETTQTILRVGIFDIDDVILNALGVMLGYFAFIILAKWIRQRKYTYLLIAAVMTLAAGAGSFYIMYPHGYEQPVLPEVGKEQEGAAPRGGDLCGGTGGTGEIVSQASGSITIKSKAGVLQTITIAPRTEIKNSEGLIAESDLKVGDHVTVVIMDESKTATAVLVCGVL